MARHPKQKINIWYKNVPLNMTSELESLGNSILKSTTLKIGDIFEYIAFNYMDDEDTKYKATRQEYHAELRLSSINHTFIDTWNSTIREIIDIHLE